MLVVSRLVLRGKRTERYNQRRLAEQLCVTLADLPRGRLAYRPVKMPYRVGVQTDEPEWASVNTIP